MTIQNFNNIYTPKAKENLVRAVIKFLPRGSAIDKLLFASKDADDTEKTEKIFDYIKSKVSENLLEQIKIKKNVNEIKKLLSKENLNVDLITGFIFNALNNFKYLTEEIHQIRNDLDTRFSQISSQLDTLINLNPALAFDNLEQYASMVGISFKEMKDSIKDFKYQVVLEFIQALKKGPNYLFLKSVFKSELDSYEARVNLLMELTENAEKMISIIIERQEYSPIICENLIICAALKKDESLYNKSFQQYEKLQLDKSKIAVQKAYWNFVNNHSDQVLNEFCNESLIIKDEYLDCEDALFYTGMAFFQKKEYQKAIPLIEAASKKNRAKIYQYQIILAKAYAMIEKRAAIFILSAKEKEELSLLYDEIKAPELFEHFRKAPFHLQEIYWIDRLTIALHISSVIALNDYLNSPEEIRNSVRFKHLYADILYFNDRILDANNLLVELFSDIQNIEIISRILVSFYQLEKYDKAIDFSGKIKNYDDEGVIVSILAECYLKTQGKEKSIEYTKSFLPSTKHPIYIYKFLGDLYSSTGEVPSAYNYYKMMLESIPVADFPPRIIFANMLRSKGFTDLALKSLEPFLTFNYEAEKLFVYDALKSGTNEQISKAEQILAKYFSSKKDYPEWLSQKIDYEIQKGNYNTGSKMLDELYSINPSPRIAYNNALTKLRLGDKNVINLAEILGNQTHPHYIMMAANCFHANADYEKSEALSLKALAINGNNFDEILFGQYLYINLGPKPGISDKAEMEIVSNDCTVLLKSDDSEIWIGITSKNEILIKENGFIFAGTTFYIRNDLNVIKLINKNKGDKIEYLTKDWIIQDIWSVKTRAVRFCLIETDNKAEKKIFTKIEFNPEKPLESIMPELVKSEIYDNEMLKDYNFRNQVGLPLHQIAMRKGRNIADAILYLLEKRNQMFYTGGVALYSLKENTFLLSPSSIILFSLSDLFDEIVNKYKDSFVISERTKSYFVDIVDKMNTVEHGIAMSIGIKNGHFLKSEYNKESKDKRLNFFNKVIAHLIKLNTICCSITPEELDKNKIPIEFISIIDYEGLKYCSENGLIYLIDDLFVRNFGSAFNPRANSINSASTFYELLDNDLDKLLIKLEELSKADYFYLYNLQSLIILSDRLLKKNLILGKGSNYDLLLCIIHNSLSQQITFNDHLLILTNFIDYLFPKRYDNRVDYLIRGIMRELWSFVSLYNINPSVLIDRIAAICISSEAKLKYYSSILEHNVDPGAIK